MATAPITEDQTIALRQIAENKNAVAEGREPRKIVGGQDTQAVKENLKLKDLEYPLNNADDYKGRLIFNVMEEAETDIGNALATVVEFGKSAVTAIASAIGTDNPEEIQTGNTAFKGEDAKTQPVTKPKGLSAVGRKVSLYLPVGLQYRDNVGYDNMDLGAMGGAAEAGLKSGEGAIRGMIEGGFKTLTSGLSGNANADVAKLATVKIMSNFPDEVSGAFRSATGVTSNPNTRVLFKSVTLREFAFAFKFYPSSRKEAEEVKEIIKLFRTELYPENINLDVAGSSISIGYKFPNKFRIDVEYDGQDIATKIKPCFLKDISVTYNNTAMSMHSDGNFQEIEMSLSFQETRTLNRKDVEEDGF